MTSVETGSLLHGQPSPAAWKLKCWKIFTAIALLITFTGGYLVINCLSVTTPMLIAEGYSGQEIGTVLSISMGMGILPKFLSGLVVDRVGGKSVALVGMLGVSIGGAMFAFGTSLWWWILCWSLVRISFSLPWPAVIKLASKWYGPDEIGKALAVLSLSWLFGNGVALLYLNGFVMIGVEWQTVYWVGAGSLFFIVCCAFIAVRESPAALGYEEPELEPKKECTAELEDNETMWQVFRPIVSSLGFWIMLVMYMGINAIYQTFLDWTPQFLVQQTGCSDSFANMGLLFFSFSGGFSALFLGYMNDRLSPVNRARLLASFLAILTMVLLCIATTNSEWEMLGPVRMRHMGLYMGLVCLSGFFLLGPLTLPSAAMSVRFGGKKTCATVCSIMDGCGWLASMSSGLMGWLCTAAGWDVVFFTLTVIALLTTLLGVAFIFLGDKTINIGCCRAPVDDIIVELDQVAQESMSQFPMKV